MQTVEAGGGGRWWREVVESLGRMQTVDVGWSMGESCWIMGGERRTYSGGRRSPESLHRHCYCYRCRKTMLICVDAKVVRPVDDF